MIGDSRWRAIRRTGPWVGAALAALVFVFYLAGGWYFSGMIDDRALDGESRRAALEPDYDLEIVGTGARTHDLEVPEDPGSLTKEGVFGIRWASGYGRLGAIRELAGSRVVRAFELVEGAAPEAGTPAELDSRAFRGDPGAVGLTFEDVTFEGELGDHPAWFVPGSRNTWVVLVHGNSMTREDGLRMLSIVSEQGFPALLISYRNAPGAPEDPSGKLRYGLTEWRDLESAVRYALEEGARDVILVGFSMGGGIVVSFLERSPQANAVRAAVLEAPMLDFSRTVDLNAAREELPLIGLGVPSSLTAVAKWMAGIRFDVGWGELDYLAAADGLDAPILLIHGTEDLDVPIETSEELAAARPDLVTFVRVSDAAHMEAWNVDPDAYAETVVAFLREVSGPSG